jgi:ribonuclease P protein component
MAANDLGVARVGFALVGIRSSVDRNLVRRRLREVVRPLLTSLAGHDLVIVAGAESVRRPFPHLQAAVGTAVVRVLERKESAAVASTADNGAMTQFPTAP